MSFIVDSFNDSLKWNEFTRLTATVLNRTPNTFQVSVLDPMSGAGLVAVQPVNMIGQDISIITDCNTATSGIGIGRMADGYLDSYSYWIVRSRYAGTVQVWDGGVITEIPDSVSFDQPAELRIVTITDPLYPLGLISFYYEGTLVYQAEIHGWIDPSVNYVSVFGEIGGVGGPGTNSYQATGYVPPPPPSYNLTINSIPLGIIFTINGVEDMNYVTPWSGILEEGTYEVEMPSNVLVGSDTYNFVQWEDGSTNPIRTVNLASDLSIEASYQLQLITALEVHAFLDSEEVIANGLIVETGYIFQTPAIIELPPATYTIRLTYLGVIKEYIATISEGDTIRVDGQMTPPTLSVPYLIIAIGLIGLVGLKILRKI